MMTRPIYLVFLLMILVVTSQFEWKQQRKQQQRLVDENNAFRSISSGKNWGIKKGEPTVQEKIILSQERRIQKLNKLVISLGEQLLNCRASNESINATIPFIGHAIKN